MKKWQFYLLSFTWGIIMSSIGCLASLVLLACGYKPRKNQYGWCFEVGKNWGGCELGCMCITNTNPSEHTLNHEFGHAIQNCYFGPFMIIISLMSAARYQYRRLLKKKNIVLPPYDSIWFEGQATKWGTEYKNITK
jgi:hypothetical protein